MTEPMVNSICGCFCVVSFIMFLAYLAYLGTQD